MFFVTGNSLFQATRHVCSLEVHNEKERERLSERVREAGKE